MESVHLSPSAWPSCSWDSLKSLKSGWAFGETIGQVQISVCDKILLQSIDLLFWGGQKNNVSFTRDPDCYETCPNHGLADQARPWCSSGIFSRVTVFSLISPAFQSHSLLFNMSKDQSCSELWNTSVVLQTGCWVPLPSSAIAMCPLSPEQDKFFAAQMHKQLLKLGRIFAIRNSRWCQTLLHTDFPAPVLIFRSSTWKICISFAMVVTPPLSTESAWPKGFTLSSQGQCNVHDWQLGKVE